MHFRAAIVTTSFRRLGALALVTLGAASSVASAQPLLIDDFSTNQAALTLTFPPAGTNASSSASGTGIIVGERDVQINLTAGVIAGNTMSATVSSGFFSYSQDATIAGATELQWDGFDADPTLDTSGMGGVDLTNGGVQDAIRVTVAFDDLPVTVNLRYHSPGGDGSQAVLNLPGLIFAPTDFIVPFSSFAPIGMTPADVASVGAVSMTIGSAVTAPDVVLDKVETAALVGVSETVALQNDVNGNTLVDPGDTLRYTAVVANPDDGFDAGASGVVLSSPAPGATALVVGSVTTSAGTVTAGNTGGDTSVGVNIGTVIDGGNATITFDVLVANPLPAFVAQISAQATVDTSTLSGVRSDDPAVGGTEDPTLIAVNGTPTLAATMSDALFVDVDGDLQADPGDTVRLTAVITNNGNQNVAGLTFATGIDPNAALVVGAVTTTQGAVTTGNGGGDTSVAVNVGTLVGGGGSVTIQFQVLIADPLPAGIQQLSHQGTATALNVGAMLTDDPGTPASGDPTVTPVVGTTTIVASLSDALFVDVDGDLTADAGDTIQLTATLANTGNQDAAGVTLAVPIDPNAGLVVGSVTTSQGTVTLGNGGGDTSVAVSVGTLVGGAASVTIQFQVQVHAPLPAGVQQLSHQGTVTATAISATVTDDPDSPAANDPTLTPLGVPVIEVPVLDTVGLASLAALLALLAVARLGRRRLALRRP
jgi:uncharacterized repeat protein (TIGR01451 family)